MDIVIKISAAFFSLWFLIVFILLIHETGHLITLAYHGLKPDKIILGNVRLFALNIGGIRHEFGLFPFFAFTISNDYAHAAHQKRVAVALAGPITSILLGGLLYAYDFASPGWYTKIAAQASIALGLWNLIPFPPMDGWPLLEWQLHRKGILITERGRMVLLFVGISLVAILSVSTW